MLFRDTQPIKLQKKHKSDFEYVLICMGYTDQRTIRYPVFVQPAPEHSAYLKTARF